MSTPAPRSRIEFIRDGHIVKEIRVNGAVIPLILRADVDVEPNAPSRVSLVLHVDEIVFTQREVVKP